jgi:acetyltransferase
MSHTGSLAPEDAIFTAACRQAGIATVTNLRDLFNAAKLLSLGTNWGEKTKIVIVTNGGGPSVNAADLVELSESMELVHFDDAIKEKLRSVLPFMAAVGNPVDVIGDAGADRYNSVLDIATGIQDVDAIIVIVTPQMMTDVKAIAETIASFRNKKSVIPVFMGGSVMQKGVDVLIDNRLVNFDLPSDAIFALDALTPHKKSPQTKKPRTPSTAVMCSYDETIALLQKYGLTIYGAFAHTKEESDRVLAEFGETNFAIKAVSRDVVHKTEARAVRLNVRPDDVSRAWDDISRGVAEKAPHATIDGMLIQPMIKGKEVIIGMKRDATFGPVIVFGLGGIFVELLNDVSMRIPPFSNAEARAMIEEISGVKYLEGFRGSEGINFELLAELLVSVGRLASENPDITEIDLNPVIMTKERAYIVDARLMRR